MAHNFFDNLGIASVERIHSQTLSWIFNEEFLSSKKKSSILNRLFDINKNYKEFQAFTEYKNIDILIKADNDVFVFENKIKIGHHDNQLENYEKAIQEDLEFSKSKPFFCYISLIGDIPDLKAWSGISYKDLLLILKKFKFNNPQIFGEHAFNEYIKCLDGLVCIFDKFQNNHQDFFNVFTDGNKKKADKIKLEKGGNYYKNQDQVYIAHNQLETTLQRYFLLKVYKKLKVKNKIISWHVDESRGNALLHIDMVEDKYNRDFLFGLQFQDKTFKIVYSKKDYKNSNQSQLNKNIKNVFQKFADSTEFHYNKPRNKAYISLSKKDKSDFFLNDFDYLVKSYQNHVDEGVKIIEKLKKYGK